MTSSFVHDYNFIIFLVVGSGPRKIGDSEQMQNMDTDRRRSQENVVYHVGESALYRRDHTELQSPLENGLSMQHTHTKHTHTHTHTH
jgi:hypothetical protein